MNQFNIIETWTGGYLDLSYFSCHDHYFIIKHKANFFVSYQIIFSYRCSVSLYYTSDTIYFRVHALRSCRRINVNDILLSWYRVERGIVYVWGSFHIYSSGAVGGGWIIHINKFKRKMPANWWCISQLNRIFYQLKFFKILYQKLYTVLHF